MGTAAVLVRLLVDLPCLQSTPPSDEGFQRGLDLLAAVQGGRGDNDVLVLLRETPEPAGLLRAREALRSCATPDEIVVVPRVPWTGDGYDDERQLAAREALIVSVHPDALLLVEPPVGHDDRTWSVDRFLQTAPTIVVSDAPAHDGKLAGCALVLVMARPDETATKVWKVLGAGDLTRPPARAGRVDRPTLALVSPWPPTRSGVADFAAPSLRYLGEHYDVTVVTDSPWSDDEVVHVTRGDFRREWWRFDRVLYHLGNSRYHAADLEMLAEAPGAVIVHDAVLSGAISSAANAFGHPGGMPSLLAWDGPDPGVGELDLRGTRAALAPALGILVHSEHARDLLREAGITTEPMRVSPLPVTRSWLDSRRTPVWARVDAPVLVHFGFVNAFKGAEEFVEAAGWLNRRGWSCRVAFVGEFLDRRLKAKVTRKAATLGVPIEITGFVTPSAWTQWLVRAACAVQLRQQSHGESSAALGDLLASGVPVVCTDTGSFAELPEGVVRHVAQGVTGEALAAVVAQVLEPDEADRLARAGQDYAQDALSPVRWADAVAAMVEEGYARNVGLLWAEAVAGLPPGPAPDFCASKMATGTGVWLSDTSVYAHTPFFSGIQRVTLGLHRELSTAFYRDRTTLFPTAIVDAPLDDPHPAIARDPILSKVHLPLGEADWLLCLDLDVRLARIRDELLAARARGLRVAVNVYDLMPVLHPEWFPRESGPDGFAPWLRVMLETADLVLVNSLSTAGDVREWVRTTLPARVDSFDLALLRLGSEFSAHLLWKQPRGRSGSHFLMVGTVEPRKGHAQVIAAFERMWARGSDVRLTIVGRPGWMVEDVVRRMKQMDRGEDRFRWAQAAGDDELRSLYARCTAVVMASEGEGFGLPVIEAAAHGCPVVVRDLSVFREVAGTAATYFRADGADLVDVLERVEEQAAAGALPAPSTDHIRPWRDVAARLGSLLRGQEPVLDTWSPADQAWRGSASVR